MSNLSRSNAHAQDDLSPAQLSPSRVTDLDGKRRDLTQIDGNPASDLRNAYGILMACDSAESLHEKATWLIRNRMENGGISKKNAASFFRIADGLKGDLVKLQGYITNWLMKAAGLSVVNTARPF